LLRGRYGRLRCPITPIKQLDFSPIDDTTNDKLKSASNE
jgi:hypothetical protein